jgi:glycosyltransferase involved in cell wall biosynthesis
VPVIIRLVTAGCVEALSKSADINNGVAELLVNPLVKIMSNSRFIAGKVQRLLGLDSTVVYPPVQVTDSVAPNWSPRYITFVNPTPLKGLATGLEVAARLPHRQFVFAESWPIRGRQRKELDANLAKLPNVTFRPRSPDLRDLYGQTALLLMPSQCEEAFGRVIIEAGANGIPVVASRIGGIPEAVGMAGVLIAASGPPDCWAKAIEEILSRPELYARLSESAFANAQREEFNAKAVSAQFLDVIFGHAKKRS